jgi:uncharacterized protein (TIGR00251 family)
MSEKREVETVIAIRVIPRSPRTRVDGMRGDAFLVRLAAPPVEGAANDALVAFLAGHLDLPRRNIRIVSGDKSRDKRVAISGLSAGAIAAKMTRVDH